MGRQKFEYHTEFAPLGYLTQTKKVLMFKSEEPTTEPDIQGFLQNLGHQQRLLELGKEGWELVSVQSVIRGDVKIGNQNAQGWAYGIALPSGFLMFFKRAIHND